MELNGPAMSETRRRCGASGEGAVDVARSQDGTKTTVCLGHASLTRKDPSSSHPATLILTTPPPVVSFSHVDDAEQRGRNPYSTEPLWLNREQGNFVDSTTVMSQNALRTCQAVNLLLVSLLLQWKE